MSQLQNSTIYCTGAAAWQLCPGCSWRSDFPASRLSPAVSANVIVANKTMHVSRYVRCEPISYLHCVPELNFSIVITWTKVSLFLFCTEVRTLPLHTTHSLAK